MQYLPIILGHICYLYSQYICYLYIYIHIISLYIDIIPIIDICYPHESLDTNGVGHRLIPQVKRSPTFVRHGLFSSSDQACQASKIYLG